MMKRYFISGIGTGVGKTLASALLCEALQADYWKPVQSGNEETDSGFLRTVVTNTRTVIHPEVYSLKQPASPHIAARAEDTRIDLSVIHSRLPATDNRLIIEGAGGLLVPLNEKEFVIDLVKKLDAELILVSRHYLGSINHSLLTAAVCRQHNLKVAGWIFNDQFMDYEQEIVDWSGYPKLASIPFLKEYTTLSLQTLAREWAPQLKLPL